MTESSNQDPIVNLLQEEQYNSIDILRLIQFCESPVGEKIIKDIQACYKTTNDLMVTHVESLNHTNLHQKHEYIIKTKEARRVVGLFKDQFFNLERLNEKYNELVAEERAIAEQRSAESESARLAAEQD